MAGVINGILYVAGGNGGTWLSTVEAYNPSTNTWITRSSMPARRRYAGAGVIDNIFYVAGGDDNTTTNPGTTFAYDAASNTWATKAAMPNPRYTVASAVLNGSLYLAGGIGVSPGGVTASSRVEAYDPSTNTWTPRAPMPTGRWVPTAAVINGLLYVVGGNDAQNHPLATLEAFHR